jgi:hypothetical protein
LVTGTPPGVEYFADGLRGPLATTRTGWHPVTVQYGGDGVGSVTGGEIDHQRGKLGA